MLLYIVWFPPKTHCWKQKWKLILINTFNLNKKPKSLRRVDGLVYLLNNKRMTKHGSELCPAKVLLISVICWCTSSEMSVPWVKILGQTPQLTLSSCEVCVCVYSLGCVSLFTTSWTTACQAVNGLEWTILMQKKIAHKYYFEKHTWIKGKVNLYAFCMYLCKCLSVIPSY